MDATTGSPRTPFLGRRVELAALERLVAGAAGGESGIVALRGEAGIGKTATLEHVLADAHDCRVIRAAGVESEMELGFGGLHQLCAPLMGHLAELPEPQRDALETAFGVRVGTPPARLVIGLAVLSLLAETAEERPLLVLIDDAQWLDDVSVQVLAFVARRLHAERIAMFFAMRETEVSELSGLPQLHLRGLRGSDARTLLRSAIPGRLDDRVRDRIVAETGGNPLAILELASGLAVSELGGGFVVPSALPLSTRIEQTFIQRVEALPAATQRLLLLAAAEPVGDAALLSRAADRLQIPASSVDAAELAGLVTVDTRVRFRHPLVRSALYRSATAQSRHEAHAALAAATDAVADPDRRAWHRAHAGTGPDETVAADLESSADRARARGGLAATAAFLERATAMTADPVRRGPRALAAAQALYQAGAFDAALDVLDTAVSLPLDDLGHARAALLRGQITFATRNVGPALTMLLNAAKQLEPLDHELAVDTYRDAFHTALTIGHLRSVDGMREVAEAARAALPVSPPVHGPELLVDGLAMVITEGYAAGVPILRQALSELRETDMPLEAALNWLPLACRMAHDAWDDETWDVLTQRLIDLARDAGALSVLPDALLSRLANRVFAGDLVAAASLAQEVEIVSDALGSRFAPYGNMVVAAWGGDEARTTEIIDSTTLEMTTGGEGQWLTASRWASAVLYNGLGRYDDAVRAAESASDHPNEMGMSHWAMLELVEAASRSGRSAQAVETAQRLHQASSPSGTDWALGVAATAGALVSRGDVAEVRYRGALEHLGRTGAGAFHARTGLLYGEWLLSEGRQHEARDQLRGAYDSLSGMGFTGFAERARLALAASGERVRRQSTSSATSLSAQEAQIARLAGDGLTNPQIGARLFLSPHTVEWHLRKVFAKLGVGSRRELAGIVVP